MPPGGHFGCVLLRRHGGQYVRKTPTAGDGKVVVGQMVQVLLFAGTEKKNINTKFLTFDLQLEVRRYFVYCQNLFWGDFLFSF